MAFKGPINFEQFEATTSQRVSDALGSGMQVYGRDDAMSNFRNWAMLSAFITTFTSKRTAQAVLKKSLRVVPVDTNELFESGKIASTEDFSAMDFPRATVIEENIEATTAAYAKTLGAKLSGSFAAPSGFFGSRVFAKYTVYYDAPHAAEVHENPYGQVWKNDSPNREFPDPKKDHFLRDAYLAYQGRYSAAMMVGLKTIEREIGNVAEKQAAALKKGALSSGTGAPRLVKRS